MTVATRASWRNTILAGLANYIDAGSIVAGSVALPQWAQAYHLSPRFLGLIGAFSANAIAAGIGALVGGWLCDRYGRKRIYQYDMIFYAFGMAWLVFAGQPWMIVVGVSLVGLAVGADIPASWSLIAEMAPDEERGKHSGVAQLLWALGPLVVLVFAFFLAPLGILGAKMIFVHLLILALLLTAFRSRMPESQRWEQAKRTADLNGGQRALLFSREHLKRMALLIGVYGLANLVGGTIGFFFPYILQSVGGHSQGAAVALQGSIFLIYAMSTYFAFMRLSDRVDQRLLFGLSSLLAVVGTLLLAIFPLTVPTLVFYILVTYGLSGCGSQSFFQLWSAELFPTLVRSTAQGLMFAVVRFALGIWSFFVPVLAARDFPTLVWILAGFLAFSGIIGVVWGPRNEGKSLEQIEAEVAARKRTARRPRFAAWASNDD